MKSGKIWGETNVIFTLNGVRQHGLFIYEGSYCSRHKHEHQYNGFYVLSGTLEISIWKNEYDLCDKTILTPGTQTIVSPGEFHRFMGVTDVLAVEWYWAEAKESDICRSDCGGINGSEMQ